MEDAVVSPAQIIWQEIRWAKTCRKWSNTGSDRLFGKISISRRRICRTERSRIWILRPRPTVFLRFRAAFFLRPLGCIHSSHPNRADCKSGDKLDSPPQAALSCRLGLPYDLVGSAGSHTNSIPRKKAVAALTLSLS